ncbi:uncharacterized protein BDR25DRAFT_83850 [Lindgomyces ingoldianus]|uniref:Uncharacterized protein n=1 Tax=Lindgomyces ingoldianus TaxID=673940 RepID=A0ACB6QEU0_9PLEO|nr:uncharacterized protein BDR25DRAFT_83850 [Lindgomyces ingoldianus]KAF2465436.1 hypothetical protein BDR25DRAFT_83850 [Lindgomyces ingoldianus]
MENSLDNLDAFYGFDPSFDPNRQTFLNLQSQSWPLPLQSAMSHNNNNNNSADANANAQHQHHQQRRLNTVAATTAGNPNSLATSSCPVAPLQTSNLGFPSAMPTANPMLTDWVQLGSTSFAQQAYNQDMATLNGPDFTTFGGPLQTSPVVDFGINTSQGQNFLSTTLSMEAPFSLMAPASMTPYQMADFHRELTNNFSSSQTDFNTTAASAGSVTTGSPTESWMELRSLSSSDNGWVDISGHRSSFDLTNDTTLIFNPHETLHIRTSSESSQLSSDAPRSAASFSSYEEIQFPMNSPQSEVENLELGHSQACTHGLPHHDHDFPYISPSQSVSPPITRAEPVDIKQPVSSSASPTSSAVSSPPSRRRKSPVGAKVAKTIVKKTPAHSTKKDHVGEKRVGRRRGPLRPDQRQQAHEIRKLRACLRCKFLKKTCDKGDPCGGCQPSHARLWQVPCTRIDIKDIAYFMKDWKADYERHVSLGFSVGNIKGFSPQERPIYVTHGYGHFLPIMAREVYVRDEKCFGVDWVETLHGYHFEINTAKLSAGMEGISHSMLSDYLDRHIDGGFEQFVDEYFEGTYFVTELLKTAYRFYCREKLPVIRKALKLVIAYNLTLHVTMVEGLPEDECNLGKVEDKNSKFCGKTVAPVMINFQVKCALADMWRELQKDVLEELSSLYSSVYSGEKLKNWPTIFMLAAILLAVWELIQFDCSYRVPDQQAVNKFCNDMESTPVGVIVGLFSAISQKLPAFTEWDTRKHHHLLNSNPAVCDAMTEVRAHVTKYETYLRSRSECKFDRSDFDSLSNKFLSKLVIRAN